MFAGLLAIALPWLTLAEFSPGAPDKLAPHILLVQGPLYLTLSSWIRFITLAHLRRHFGI